MVQYKSGRPIPKNVLSTVYYVSKIGLLTTAQWHRQFGKGNHRWRQKQLKDMVDKRLIQPHTASWKGFWVLNTEGERIAAQNGRTIVDPVPPNYFEHDLTIGESMLNIERSKVCKSWAGERELKLGGHEYFQYKTKEGEVKYPDAIFIVKVKGKEVQVALEYERTGKSLARYKDIMNCYSTYKGIELFIFVTETDTIRRRIKKAQNFVNSEFLKTRVAYVGVDDWGKDPANAKLEINGKTIILSEVCERYT